MSNVYLKFNMKKVIFWKISFKKLTKKSCGYGFSILISRYKNKLLEVLFWISKPDAKNSNCIKNKPKQK